MHVARTLFDEFDKDGSNGLDEDELSQLVQQLFKKLGPMLLLSQAGALRLIIVLVGKPIGADFRLNLLKEIRKIMDEFDTDKNGTLSFSEFLRMLTRRPWKELMPAQVH